jgi:hypothetical protein
VKAIQTRPAAAPMPKAIAVNWNGGTRPDAAVIKASSAHIRTALNPISVALRLVPVMIRPENRRLWIAEARSAEKMSESGLIMR